MLEQFRSKFEDTEKPYLGPNIKILKSGGLIFPKTRKMKCLYFTLHFVVYIFVITEFIDIWMERANLQQLLRNFKYTMLSVINCSKIFTYFQWQGDWLKIIDFITRRDIERRYNKNKETEKIITSYTKYSRLVTFSCIYLLSLTVTLVIMQPLFLNMSPTYRFNVKNGTEKRIEVVNSWMPFDKTTIHGYIVTIFIQAYGTFFGGLWVILFDTNALSIIIFVEAELRMLKIDARNIFGTEKQPVSEAEAKRRIKKCHDMHLELYEICNIFNSLLSPIMLLYTIICSIMLCVTAYQIQVETSSFQKMITAQYLIFGVSQLFTYCWHSSLILYSSLELSLGPYESSWYLRSVKEKKDLQTLVYQFLKPLSVQAGPINDLTVVTFISIVKGAYSFYTLLREMRKT